jgi:predicted deacylase/methionine-rich copper-binding protein CopC
LKVFDKKIFKNYSFKHKRLFIIMFSISLLFLFSLSGSYAAAANNTSISNNSSVNSSQSTYNISFFDKTVGGNVLNNTVINEDIPKTNLSNTIFNMTRNGSVILKFGNGNGPKILISVGVHGNEPQANIAGMIYLEFIKDKQFNGTLYIIPFDIPQDTAQDTRYYDGLDPNRIANINGTPSWKIVQFARDNGIQYFIDIHSGGGVGPNGFIYVNQNSTTLEKNWVNYIVSKTDCDTGLDAADGPGMIRDAAHSYGINSITLETERDTTPVMTAAMAEFKMLIAAVTYLGFPGTQYHPLVTSSNPPVNGTGYSLNAPVTVKFNENIQTGPNFSGIYIKNLNTGNIVSVASETISGNILTIKQTYTRLSGDLYQVYIPTGAVQDLAGNNQTTSYSYIFKTTTNTTSTQPSIISSNPNSNAKGVSLTSPITISFNENITAGPNLTGIYIKNLNTGNIVHLASENINGNTLTIQQATSRLYGDTYQVYLPAGVVKDVNGYLLPSAFSYNLTSITLITPTIIGSNPNSNATGVSLTTPIIIQFNENITSGANYSDILH